MTRGKHTKGRNPAFLRDLSVMGIGVVVVALLVFGALWVLASIGDDTVDDAAAVTTTTSPPVRTSSTRASTTTEAPTSTSTSSTTTEASTSTTVATSTTVTLRDPGDVRVLVLNAVGVSGLARRVTEELSELGYDLLEPSNYSPPLDRSRIWYREGFGPDALELGTVITDALIEFGEDVPTYGDVDVVVVLGSSFEG